MAKNINATHYDRIPAFPSTEKKHEHVVNAIIETPKRSNHKYNLVPRYGLIAFHRVLPDGLDWPYDYGFVPQTIAPDGDPLDILLINEDGLFSGCLIEARIIGAVRETKDGIENDRLIGVPMPSPGAPQPTDHYFELSDLPPTMLEHIKDFLVTYSSDQGHRIQVKALVNAQEALATVKRCMKQFRKKSA
jgi:inorganic pyrophosphatase